MNYALAVTNPQRKESSDTQKNIPNKNSTNLNLQSSIIRKSLSKVDIVPINQEGLSPYVSFELFIPFIDNKGGEEIINKTEYEKISVDGLEKKPNKISDYALYLLSRCMDDDFDIKGGYTILGEDKDTHQDEICYITQALGLVYAINEMLKSERETIIIPISQKKGIDIELVRTGNLVRVKRSYNDDKPEWFKFDELALGVRKAGKSYIKAAQAIDDYIDRKMSIITDSVRKENLQKKRDIISRKLQIDNFITSLKNMKELFLKSDIPSIRENFAKQKLERDESKRRLIEGNRDMMEMALKAAPEGFLEMDMDNIVREYEIESKPLTAPKEKKKKKSKSEIRREQEENFDNEEQFHVFPSSIPLKQYQSTKKGQNNIASKNIYDLGEISQENIFKIDQEERYTKKDYVQKRETKQSKKKKLNTNKTIKQREPKHQNRKELKMEKGGKEKSKPKIIPKSKIRKETADLIVILLGTLVILVLLYYSYYANIV